MSHIDNDRPPYLGYGLGLRVEHYQELLDHPHGVDWLEIVSENYMVPGGLPLVWLERFRARFPLVMHGVSLSIGGTDPLDDGYLARLDALARRIEPAWVSDHLCWTGVQGVNLHDLMPLPYTEEALDHVVARVRQVQDRLRRRILLENVSSYLRFADAQLEEWEFLAAVAERADCLLLLDINNVYVSARNHGFDPLRYLDGVPVQRVQQFHLAGHEQGEALLVDTHDAPVPSPVWALYEAAVRRFGAVSTMIERDDHMPPLRELVAELDDARRLAEPLLRAAA
ncbi:DUF692 domain-containing protein [Dyella marensis]|uniref:UPF0276 protein SAMN02799615_02164 n=1 Tax=Dyella marensis TaxID=500610 RepID=A0A1I2F098_9GAMM|nr:MULTISPECIES: DUF692 domain-containing protein [Dyella]SFE98277.1 hypothetical protein SAMN02799615_02164 [Dyella marensis]